MTTRKDECVRCGREIAHTHMKRHLGTWACVQTGYFVTFGVAWDTPLEEGYDTPESPAAATELATKLGIQDQLKPYILTAYGSVSVGLQAPDWICAAARTLAWYRHEVIVRIDVTLVCRYFRDHPNAAIRDGMLVALGLLRSDQDLNWRDIQEQEQELFRATAGRIMNAHPDYALGDDELDLSLETKD